MPDSFLKYSLNHYIKTTTLHGFKYLLSPYRFDKIFWLLGCVGSACCGGSLCAVLWARFLQTPALVTLHDPQSVTQPMPMLAICMPVDKVAELYLQSVNNSRNLVLTSALIHVLYRNPVPQNKLLVLEQFLQEKNTSLSQIMEQFTPQCHDFVQRCRWQKRTKECDRIFKKQRTRWGTCCVVEQKRLLLSANSLLSADHLELNLLLKCADDADPHGCTFLIRYKGDGWHRPKFLAPGRQYWSSVTFVYSVDNSQEEVLGDTCVSDNGYSKSRCMDECMEQICGCIDPLHEFRSTKHDTRIRTCRLTDLNCLRRSSDEKTSKCSCLHPCTKFNYAMLLEDAVLTSDISLDPLQMRLNATLSTILNFHVRLRGSKVFERRPTETWFTLLSSLGGVFNMFLGVGAFSAFELVFFVLLRLPCSLKKSSKIHVSQ